MLNDIKNIKSDEYIDEGVVQTDGVTALSKRIKSAAPSYFTDIF